MHGLLGLLLFPDTPTRWSLLLPTRTVTSATAAKGSMEVLELMVMEKCSPIQQQLGSEEKSGLWRRFIPMTGSDGENDGKRKTRLPPVLTLHSFSYSFPRLRDSLSSPRLSNHLPHLNTLTFPELTFPRAGEAMKLRLSCSKFLWLSLC